MSGLRCLVTIAEILGAGAGVAYLWRWLDTGAGRTINRARQQADEHYRDAS